jgi:polyisoprenoid-binding protein YceI
MPKTAPMVHLPTTLTRICCSVEVLANDFDNMYRTLFAFLFILGSVLIATAGKPGDDYVKINPAASKILWTGKKVTGQHHGSISLKEGTLQMQKGVLVGGSFTIDMSTIKDLDLNGEYAGKLENHLKSDDFFGVATYPVATLIILEVKPKEYNAYDIKANLTIKGITQPIEFVAIVKPEGKNYRAESKLNIDRSLFNVKYGSGKFYDDLGDKTIYDEFELNVTLVTE